MANDKKVVFEKLNNTLIEAEARGVVYAGTEELVAVPLEKIYGSYLQHLFSDNNQDFALSIIYEGEKGETYAGHFNLKFSSVKDLDEEYIYLSKMIPLYTLEKGNENIEDADKDKDHFKMITMEEFMGAIKNPHESTITIVNDVFSSYSHTYNYRFANPAYNIDSFLARTLK